MIFFFCNCSLWYFQRLLFLQYYQLMTMRNMGHYFEIEFSLLEMILQNIAENKTLRQSQRHTCRIFHVLQFKMYINSHGIFLVNIVTVKINEVLRMGWKMHLGVVILNLPILKSSLHVYHTLLSSSNLKLWHWIKIRSSTHWWFSVMDFCIDWCFIVCSSGVPQSSLGLYGVLCPHQWTWQEQLGLSSPPCWLQSWAGGTASKLQVLTMIGITEIFFHSCD